MEKTRATIDALPIGEEPDLVVVDIAFLYGHGPTEKRIGFQLKSGEYIDINEFFDKKIEKRLKHLLQERINLEGNANKLHSTTL